MGRAEGKSPPTAEGYSLLSVVSHGLGKPSQRNAAPKALSDTQAHRSGVCVTKLSLAHLKIDPPMVGHHPAFIAAIGQGSVEGALNHYCFLLFFSSIHETVKDGFREKLIRICV